MNFVNPKTSVFYCCRNMMYDNATINQIKILDNTIIPTPVIPLISTTMSQTDFKNLDKYLYNDITINGRSSVAVSTITLFNHLKQSFEYKMLRKCYCSNKIGWSNKYGTSLTHTNQFNLYLYMFNENSSLPPIYNMSTYKSLFRVLYDSSIRVLNNFKNL